MRKYFLVFVFLSFLPLIAEESLENPKYKIDQFYFEYVCQHKNFPTHEQLQLIEISLTPVEEGFDVYKGEGEKISVELKNIGDLKPNYFTKNVINLVAKKVVKSVQKEGYRGIVVKVDPNEIDSKGNDHRSNGRLDFTVRVAKISKVHTKALGNYVSEEESLNYSRHQKFIDKSPIQKDEYLHAESLDDYVHKVNRHPFRNIRAMIEEDDEGEDIILKYLVAEQKPWLIYVSAMNTGTHSTKKWEEVVGYINTQFTRHDDTLTLVYFTASFKSVWAITGSYQLPLPKDFYIRLTGYYNDFNASILGDLNNEFLSKEVGGELEVGNTFYQNKNFFIDAFFNSKWRNMHVENTISLINAYENFYIPEIGLRFDKNSDDESLKSTFTFGGNIPGIAGTDQSKLVTLGSPNLDKNFQMLRLRLYYSTFLRSLKPSSFPEDKTYYPPHQVLFICNGQYGFDYRIIPQEKVIYGGMFTVRGYSELITSGDTGLNSTFQYQYHIARGYANNLAYKNKLPNWDLLLSCFIDYGGTIINKHQDHEMNYSLLGSGVGLEFKLGANLVLHGQLAFPLTPFHDPVNSSYDVKKYKRRIHLNGTLLY